MITTPDRESVLQDLATAAGLDADEIEPDEDLLGLGVDSVRLMRLVERWRAAGKDVTFADVAACATVDEALRLVAAAPPV